MAVLAMKLTDATRTSRGRWRRISTIGSLLRALSRRSAVKTGLSLMRSRMTSPTATSTVLIRNGSRQPQLPNWASVSQLPSTKNIRPPFAARPGRPRPVIALRRPAQATLQPPSTVIASPVM
jgi:hypothetical protein